MCGISAFIGNKNAFKRILDSLLQLQNRGYDSAGISVFDGENLSQKSEFGYSHRTKSGILEEI